LQWGVSVLYFKVGAEKRNEIRFHTEERIICVDADLFRRPEPEVDYLPNCSTADSGISSSQLPAAFTNYFLMNNNVPNYQTRSRHHLGA